MENILNTSELDNLNKSVKTVQATAFFTEGIYEMKVVSMESKVSEKNGLRFLTIWHDTGFKTQGGLMRKVNATFQLEGKYKDGRDRIEDLARYLKMGFKLKEISNENLALIINRRLAVATRKETNAEGNEFLNFWYSDHLDNIDTMRKSFKKFVYKNAAVVEPEMIAQTVGEKLNKMLGDNDLPF